MLVWVQRLQLRILKVTNLNMLSSDNQIKFKIRKLSYWLANASIIKETITLSKSSILDITVIYSALQTPRAPKTLTEFALE